MNFAANLNLVQLTKIGCACVCPLVAACRVSTLPCTLLYSALLRSSLRHPACCDSCCLASFGLVGLCQVCGIPLVAIVAVGIYRHSTLWRFASWVLYSFLLCGIPLVHVAFRIWPRPVANAEFLTVARRLATWKGEGKGGSQGERRGEGRRQGRRQGQEATATAATLMAVRCNSGGCGSPCGWWCLFLRLLRKRAQEGRSSLLLLAARDVLALAYGS